MLSKKVVQRIKPGVTVSWQRQTNNIFSGEVLAFCPKGAAIRTVLDVSGFHSRDLRRIDLERDAIDRYLIYVENIGVVSISSTTIEKQNPNAERSV